MGAPLNTCTTIGLRGVVRFLWAKIMDAAKDFHKEMLPVRVFEIYDKIRRKKFLLLRIGPIRPITRYTNIDTI
jgi:hypothetical protein